MGKPAAANHQNDGFIKKYALSCASATVAESGKIFTFSNIAYFDGQSLFQGIIYISI